MEQPDRASPCAVGGHQARCGRSPASASAYATRLHQVVRQGMHGGAGAKSEVYNWDGAKIGFAFLCQFDDTAPTIRPHLIKVLGLTLVATASMNKSLLETGVPTARNQFSVHGQGQTPQPVPEYRIHCEIYYASNRVVECIPRRCGCLYGPLALRTWCGAPLLKWHPYPGCSSS